MLYVTARLNTTKSGQGTHAKNCNKIYEARLRLKEWDFLLQLYQSKLRMKNMELRTKTKAE